MTRAAGERIVDPTPYRVRHVRRPRSGEPATAVLLGSFHAARAAELDALNGEAGWQSADVATPLSDDGELTIRFPNAAGDDGVLHRERFALLTDPLYRIGEEWIELYREPVGQENLEAVITPRTWKIDRNELVITGPDVMALYTLARSSELDVWHDAPRDVWDFYSRLPVALASASFEGWTTSSPPGGSPWSSSGQTAPGAIPGARLVSASSTPATLERNLDDGSPIAWSAEARIVLEAPPSAGTDVRLVVTLDDGATVTATFLAQSGELTLTGTDLPAGGVWRARGKTRRTMPGGASLKLLCRRRWVYAYLEGELLARASRDGSDQGAAGKNPANVRVEVRSGTVVVVRADVEAVLPFGLRGTDKGDRALPGRPTPGGLRGRYWHESSTQSVMGTSAQVAEAALDPLTEPTTSRLDTTLDSGGSGTTWQPPSVQSPLNSFSARWTGAIYLDLAAADRMLRLSTLDDAARVWVGRTLIPSDAVIDSWTIGAKSDVRSPALRDLLGSKSGWFPIVVEYVNTGGAGGIVLQDSPLDGSGNPTTWTTVPSTRLSPLGCYEETHRNESHRELLSAVAQMAGFQWRVEPRTLESGEFPGQIPPRARVGVDTDLVLADDHAVELAGEGDAGDAVDRILIDAAGIADPKGAAQLSASVVNDEAVSAGHLFLSTGAESLPEITEPNLLEQRADSLLALKASPNEQIAARPQGLESAVTDTFPLTGALARRRWRPGDGLRLALDDLSVVDRTPRQLVTLTRRVYRDGAGAPTTGWRQRPRGLRAFLQRVARATYAAQRNPQGTLGIVLGTFANLDDLSRVVIPRNLEDVVRAEVVVVNYNGATGDPRIEVNGADTGVRVRGTGRYPVDRWIAREAAGGTADNRMYSRIIGRTGGGIEHHLELLVRI